MSLSASPIHSRIHLVWDAWKESQTIKPPKPLVTSCNNHYFHWKKTTFNSLVFFPPRVFTHLKTPWNEQFQSLWKLTTFLHVPVLRKWFIFPSLQGGKRVNSLFISGKTNRIDIGSTFAKFKIPKLLPAWLLWVPAHCARLKIRTTACREIVSLGGNVDAKSGPCIVHQYGSKPTYEIELIYRWYRIGRMWCQTYRLVQKKDQIGIDLDTSEKDVIIHVIGSPPTQWESPPELSYY